MTTDNIKILRSALSKKYGPRNYRITKDREVHIYGVMHNTNQVGWWYRGQDIDVFNDLRKELA